LAIFSFAAELDSSLCSAIVELRVAFAEMALTLESTQWLITHDLVSQEIALLTDTILNYPRKECGFVELQKGFIESSEIEKDRTKAFKCYSIQGTSSAY